MARGEVSRRGESLHLYPIEKEEMTGQAEKEEFDIMKMMNDESGMTEILAFLQDDTVNEEVKKKAISAQDKKGLTTLYVALRRNACFAIIEEMVKIGGKDVVLVTNNFGETILHEATHLGSSYEIFKLLVDYGGEECLLKLDKSGDTPLHHGMSSFCLIYVSSCLDALSLSTLIFFFLVVCVRYCFPDFQVTLISL